MSEIVAYQAASLTDRMKYANTLAAAGDLIPRGLRDEKNQPSPGKILLVMETGAMLGLNPMAALQGIDVIEGKATISPQLMTALVRTAGHKIEITKSGSVRGGDFALTAKLTRSDDGTEYESVWSPQRALQASLLDSYQNTPQGWVARARSKYDKPLNWETHTETMCQWRAIGDVCRVGADDALKGIAYTREEIESGVSITSDPDPEPTEDWARLIMGASTLDELEEIRLRLAEKGEGTDPLRLEYAKRRGDLEREANIEDAEEVNDDGTATEPVSSASGVRTADATSDTAGDGAVDQGSERLAGNDAGRLVGDQSAALCG